MTLFFMGDPHFGHAAMIHKFTLDDGKTPARKFASVEEMDETIIANINARVRPNDHLYFIGDLGMKKSDFVKALARINCRHMRNVGGNHDIYGTAVYQAAGIEHVFGCRVIDNLLLTHIPVAPWSFGRFRANIHGHVHMNTPKLYTKIDPATFLPKFRYVNLSAERIDYSPVSLEEINAWLR